MEITKTKAINLIMFLLSVKTLLYPVHTCRKTESCNKFPGKVIYGLMEMLLKMAGNISGKKFASSTS